MIGGFRRHFTAVALVLSGFWALAIGLGHLDGDNGLIDRLEATLTDLRTTIRGPQTPPRIVTIVAIDDASAASAGAYPLPRATLAKVVDAVARLRPKVLAVDMLLVDAGPEEGDEALATALGQQGRAVLAAAAVFAGEVQETAAPSAGDPLGAIADADRLILPLARFADVASVGVVNVATDESGVPRAIPMLFRSGNRLESAFALRAAAVALGNQPSIEPGGLRLGERFIRTDTGQQLPLSFYGPRGSIRTVSAVDLLDGKVSTEDIAGRVVVLGATVTGGGDVFATPFDPVLPGVEVMATAITHLVAGDGMVRDATVRQVDLALAVALTVLVIGLLAWRRNLWGLVAIALAMLATLAANMLAFQNGIWLSAALPLAAAMPPLALFGAAQLWLGRRRATYFAEQSQRLQRIQAPGMVEWLATHPEFLATPVRQNAAIVFIDLSGFTGLSEAIGPSETRDLLDGFYQCVDQEVTASGGAITSFMGDGAMILFGLPEASEADAAGAIRCCVQLARRMAAWRLTLPPSVASRVGYKIGGHYGPVVASRLGTQNRQQITATGDTVNAASRLMEVASRNGVPLAVSDDLLLAAGPDSAARREGILVGPLDTTIRGRAGQISVWLWSPDSA